VGTRIVAIVDRCLEKEREQCFATAADLARALTTVLEHVGGAVGQAPPLTTLTEALFGVRSVKPARITGDESTALAGDGSPTAADDDAETLVPESERQNRRR
jgi:hypothetical protein